MVSGGDSSAVTFSNKPLYLTGTALATLSAPEVESGYFFMGWFLDASEEHPVGSQYLTGDTTVYAKVVSLAQAKSSYTVSFQCGTETDPDSVILPSSATYSEDYDLSLLPEPEVSNGIFLCWYRDTYCNTLASGGLSQNTTVYALVQAIGSPMVYTPSFISSEYVGVDFTFQVWGNSEAEICNALSLIDTTAENADFFYTLSNISNNVYTVHISSYQDGEDTITTTTYTEGHIYKATLPEDSVVCFVSGGEVQGTSVRELNFTIAKADVQNLQLSKELIYIPSAEVSNLTGDTQSGLYGLDVASDGVATSDNAGVFTYTNATLSFGDTIAIYKGTRPDQQGVGYALTAGVLCGKKHGFSLTSPIID